MRDKRKSIADIVQCKPMKIQGKKYLIYCDYGHHRGVIKNERKYLDCVQKKCEHLYVFPIGKDDRRQI